MEHHHNAEQDINDLEVVVEKICPNVTRHAKSEVGCYRIEIEHHQSHIVLLVVNQEPGFDPADVPRVGEARPDLDIGDFPSSARNWLLQGRGKNGCNAPFNSRATI